MTPRGRSTATQILAVVNVTVLVLGVSVSSAERFVAERPRPAVAMMALEGSARISGPEGRRMVTGGAHGLYVDDLVDLLAGDAVLDLVGGGSIELRSDPGGGGSRLALGDVTSLLAGDALVVAPEGREVAVHAGGARLSLAGGAGRVSRSTGATFVVYSGAAALSSGGRTLRGGLPPLRQVVVPAPGKLPMTPSPLSFGVVPDPWDRRFLGDAIDLQAALESRSIGITTSLRDDISPDVFFFQAVLPGLLHEPTFDQALLDGQRRPVGETLIGAAVALFGQGATFDDRWHEVFRLREGGAGWGVVALDQEAPRASLMSSLDDAVNRSPLVFGGPSPSPVFEPRLPPPRPRRVAPEPPTPPAPPARVTPPRPPPAPPTQPSVSPPAPTGAPESVLEPVVDPLVNLLDDVLEGLGGLTRGLL